VRERERDDLPEGIRTGDTSITCLLLRCGSYCVRESGGVCESERERVREGERAGVCDGECARERVRERE